MRTRMHQEAFPGEDISDRPPPEESVPGLLALDRGSLPSGRFRARDLSAVGPVSALAFELTPALEASEPPEARGLARDEVRLMVARRASDAIVHTRFRDAPQLPRARRSARDQQLDDAAGCSAGDPGGGAPSRCGSPPARPLRGQRPTVSSSSSAPPAGFAARDGRSRRGDPRSRVRRRSSSWRPTPAAAGSGSRVPTDSREPLHRYLNRHGHPIRYGYVPEDWPLSAYQTVYATVPGSAEMPSAGRPFTAELLTRLIAMGVPSRRSRCTPESPHPSATSRRTPRNTTCLRQRRA